MISRVVVSCLTLSLAGCASYAPSVPENYSGPRAQLSDSDKVYSNTKADFFIAEQINGADIENSIHATVVRNQNRGAVMTPVVMSRPIVAGTPIKIEILGRTHYGAPILELASTVYMIEGVVEFTPEPDAKYVVKGELGEKYSAIWVENSASNETVGQKIEINGSAKLGFFDK